MNYNVRIHTLSNHHAWSTHGLLIHGRGLFVYSSAQQMQNENRPLLAGKSFLCLPVQNQYADHDFCDMLCLVRVLNLLGVKYKNMYKAVNT